MRRFNKAAAEHLRGKKRIKHSVRKFEKMEERDNRKNQKRNKNNRGRKAM